MTLDRYDPSAGEQEPWLALPQCSLRSRLLIGLDQFESPSVLRDVLIASGAELLIVTTGSRRAAPALPLASILSEIGDLSLTVVGTTCNAGSSGEAVAVARRLRAALGIAVVKLDVRPDTWRSVPDNRATIAAARELREDGFDVLPMIVPEEAAAIELERLGCAAVRLLAGAIRSGGGVTNIASMKTVRSAVKIPCIGEGGIATVADAAYIIESGFDAVLVNSAISKAHLPAQMARAMHDGVAAAHMAYTAGRMPHDPQAACGER